MATTTSSVPSVHVNGAKSHSASALPSDASPSGASPTSATSDSPTGESPVIEPMGVRIRPQEVVRMAARRRPLALPLRHEWTFWHDKHQANRVSSPATVAGCGEYESQLKEMRGISTIQEFWQVYNNIPFRSLALRDSILMFKKNVKPVWEDPRNNNGGAWTFRILKSSNNTTITGHNHTGMGHSHTGTGHNHTGTGPNHTGIGNHRTIDAIGVWKEILAMAIGEELQEVVEKGDDICGISMSVRFNAHLIHIWNRDGSNQKSIDAICERVLSNLSEDLKPLVQKSYYKKHSEHKEFRPLGDTNAGCSKET
ncbi:hypothetical protein DRE_01776 [Drechslerella stenobrocha 248]|uniref:Uncharacterized protein n=1 Tax=Drechslerella stenobrocha 248 TaxID=1043628 RepID=W7HYH7_9PEZI|nr:hypothetical protein DRE_01776 [Drechslerella stenobrocha 248]